MPQPYSVSHLSLPDLPLGKKALHPYSDEAAQSAKFGFIEIKPLRLHHNDRKLFRVEAFRRFA